VGLKEILTLTRGNFAPRPCRPGELYPFYELRDYYYKIPGSSFYMRVPGNHQDFVRLPDGFRCKMPKWTLEIRVKQHGPMTDYKIAPTPPR
jgi:hypothetical protein